MRITSTLAILFAVTMNPATAPAQGGDRQESQVEREARLARSGAGISVGYWNVLGLQNASGATSSSLPAITGWHQRGFDRHISIESSLGVWGNRQSITRAGGLGSAPTSESISTYVVPLMTSGQFAPFTGPESRIEPFLRAGGGFALGIENREGSGGSLFGGSQGTSAVVGFALQGGAGAIWRASGVFGLTGTAGYRWTHFGDGLSGMREYKGLHADVGVLYRFQY